MLERLKDALENITFGDMGAGSSFCDLYLLLQKFFEQQSSKEALVRSVQENNYNKQIWTDDGRAEGKPLYSPYTIDKRRAIGYYIPASKQWVAHETGQLFHSMGLLVTPNGVSVVAVPNGGEPALDIDFMESTTSVWGIDEDTHIEDYFELYDPDCKTLGLTDENIESLMGEMKEFVLNGLKEYFKNG